MEQFGTNQQPNLKEFEVTVELSKSLSSTLKRSKKVKNVLAVIRKRVRQKILWHHILHIFKMTKFLTNVVLRPPEKGGKDNQWYRRALL